MKIFRVLALVAALGIANTTAAQQPETPPQDPADPPPETAPDPEQPPPTSSGTGRFTFEADFYKATQPDGLVLEGSATIRWGQVLMQADRIEITGGNFITAEGHVLMSWIKESKSSPNVSLTPW